jgi:hypothetical protein
MLKKDARILFNLNADGKITRLAVFKFTEENKDSLQYLYRQFSHDFGNCNSDWDRWNLISVMFRLFIDYDFLYRDSRLDAIEQLRKIDEFREQIDSACICHGWLKIYI